MKVFYFYLFILNHGLTVPCASVREHKCDKIPVMAPRT